MSQTGLGKLGTAALRLMIATVIAIPLHAGTVPAWDVSGNWNLNYYVQLGAYILPIDFISEDLQTGDLTANIGIQGLVFLDGSVTDSTINFDFGGILVDSLGSPFSQAQSWTGTIAPDGSMAGTMTVNNGHGPFHGSWGTTSGQAQQVTPEPGSLSLLGIALVLTSLRQMRGASFRRTRIPLTSSRQ